MTKKFSMVIITLMVAGMLTACGNPAPTAELDYQGGNEIEITERIIVENES